MIIERARVISDDHHCFLLHGCGGTTSSAFMMLLLALVGGTRSPGGLEDASGHCSVRGHAHGMKCTYTYGYRFGEFALVSGTIS